MSSSNIPKGLQPVAGGQRSATAGMTNGSTALLIASMAIALMLSTNASGIDIIVEKREEVQVQNARVNFGAALRNTIDRRLFANQKNAEGLESHLRQGLATKLRELTYNYYLTPSQRQEVELAGQGDIHVLMQDCRRLSSQQVDRENANQILQEVRKLRAKVDAGLHKEGSMLARTFKSTLKSEQREKLLLRRTRLLENAFQAQIRQVVVLLDDSLPMKQSQRVRLSAFLAENVSVPTIKLDPEVETSMSWHILYQVSKLPDAKLNQLKSIFQKKQWDRVLARLKWSQRLEEQFERMGFEIEK